MPPRTKIYDAPDAAGFPARLQEARSAARMSQGALGTAIGYSPPSARQAIDGLEKGRFLASIEVVEALARVIGVRSAWLAYGDGEPTH